MKRFFAVLLALLMLMSTALPAMAEEITEPEVTEPEVTEPEVVTHTVTFLINIGRNGVYQTVEVEDGDTVEDPGKLRVRGYLFKAFFTKPNGGRRFDFSTPITEDTVLYARWVPIALLFGGLLRNEPARPEETPDDDPEEDLPHEQHVWGEAVVTTPATCGAAGESTATCACGETQKTPIPATGAHDFDETTRTCKNCPASYPTLEEISTQFDSGTNTYTFQYGIYIGGLFDDTVIEAKGPDATLTIDNGTFKNYLRANNCSITINDGTFEVRMIWCDSGSITINGGTFTHTNFELYGDGGTTFSIKGGTFAVDPTSNLADGYVATKGEDNMWTVSKAD